MKAGEATPLDIEGCAVHGIDPYERFWGGEYQYMGNLNHPACPFCGARKETVRYVLERVVEEVS